MRLSSSLLPFSSCILSFFPPQLSFPVLDVYPFHPPRYHRQRRRRCWHLRQRLRRSHCCRRRGRRRRPAAAAGKNVEDGSMPLLSRHVPKGGGGGGNRSRRLNHGPGKVTPTTSCYQQFYNPFPAHATSPIPSPPTPLYAARHVCAHPRPPLTSQPFPSGFRQDPPTPPPNPRCASLPLFPSFLSCALLVFSFNSGIYQSSSSFCLLRRMYSLRFCWYLSFFCLLPTTLHSFPSIFSFPLSTSIFFFFPS